MGDDESNKSGNETDKNEAPKDGPPPNWGGKKNEADYPTRKK